MNTFSYRKWGEHKGANINIQSLIERLAPRRAVVNFPLKADEESKKLRPSVSENVKA